MSAATPSASAQTATLKTLYTASTSGSGGSNFEASPIVGSDGNVYITAQLGGSACSEGCIAKVSPSGEVTFVGAFNGADGSAPVSGLIQARDGNFYGDTSLSSNGKSGVIFRMTPSGNLSGLYTFDPNAGGDVNPVGTLMQGNDGNLYGTVSINDSASSSSGSIFKLTAEGAFSSLYSFENYSTQNTVGSYPLGGLVTGSDGYLYGTTAFGGSGGGNCSEWYFPPFYYAGGNPACGTLFKTSPDGAFTQLHSFSGSDGYFPSSTLIQGTDGNFYGTTFGGGSGTNCTAGCGTIFKMTPSGTLTTLYSFNGTDGANPYASLLEGSDGNFYGTTVFGGSGSCIAIATNDFNTQVGSGCGTIFRITPEGDLTVLYSFDGTSQRSYPFGGLVEAPNGKIYGTTGGFFTGGTIFELGLSPALPSPNVTSKLTSRIIKRFYTAQSGANGEGPAGVETFDIRFCNNSTTSLSGLYAQITRLGNNNSLINRTVGSTQAGAPGGVGAELVFPAKTSSSPALPASACITVPFEIGLSKRALFAIDWKLYGHQ